MMQPTDQMSTEEEENNKTFQTFSDQQKKMHEFSIETPVLEGKVVKDRHLADYVD